MNDSITIEEEMTQRQKAVEMSLNCIYSFLDSVDFYIKKLYLYPSQDPDTCDQDLNLRLFEFLEAEAMRAVQHVAKIARMSATTLLPITRVDPQSLIMLAISRLNAPSYEAFNAVEESRVMALCQQIRSQLSSVWKKPVVRSHEEAEEMFQQLKERYCQDYQEALAYFRDDYEKQMAGTSKLNEDFKDCQAVQLYQQSEMSITNTLSLMSKSDCTEHDLLQLLAYIVRLEILRQMAVDARQQEMQERPSDEDAVIADLKPIFYGDEKAARAFLKSIKGLKPAQVIQTVKTLLEKKKISMISQGRRLWEILHQAGYYAPELRNWYKYLK